MIEQSKGPFCQSCGMPLVRPEDFGTAADEFRINDYCHFCFQHGSFTDPDMTPLAMIEKCVALMAPRIMPEAEARALLTGLVPQLQRWRSAASRRHGTSETSEVHGST